MDKRLKRRQEFDKLRENLLKDDTKDNFKPIKRKKKKLEESLGVLPSKKMFKYNPDTGTYNTPEIWTGSDSRNNSIEEGSYKSNINKKWDTVKQMSTDMIQFMDDVYDANGEDGINDMIPHLARLLQHAKKLAR